MTIVSPNLALNSSKTLLGNVNLIEVVVGDKKFCIPAVNYASNDFSDIKSLLQILSHDSVKLFWVVLWWLDSLADGTVRLLQRKIIKRVNFYQPKAES